MMSIKVLCDLCRVLQILLSKYAENTFGSAVWGVHLKNVKRKYFKERGGQKGGRCQGIGKKWYLSI